MRSILIAAGLTAAVLGIGFMAAQEKKDKGADRDGDKAAIQKLATELAEAFDKRDAAAIAANYTLEGEYLRNDGDLIHGRAEIEKGYAEFFKTLKGKTKLEVQLDSLRFTSADTAATEATLRLKNEAGEVIASSWRDTLLVREGGQWKITSAHEWDRDETMDVSLNELEWLIGTWTVASKEKQVTTTYEWGENKTFIKGSFTVKEGDKVVESGTQMICKDNAAGAIHSWVFSNDGSFGDGIWTREGKKWTVDVSGVTPEGSELNATAIYIHLDANTYTWQSVDQSVNGEAIPDTQPIKVTKQPKGK